MKMFRPATAVAIACFAIFILIDFGGLGYYDISTASKYVGLLCCVYCAFAGTDSLLGSTLFLTAVCDFFLLFTDRYLEGILIFIIAQALHNIRCLRLNEIKARFVAVPAAVALITGVIGFLYTKEPVAAAALAYAVLLLSAAGLACASFFRMKQDIMRTGFTALGFVLFVACDICVALYNLGDPGAVNWIWIFYLPSQWLLAASGMDWKADQKETVFKHPVRV